MDRTAMPKMTKPCSVEGCERQVEKRGLCSAHLSRLKRHGDVQASVPVREFDRTCSVEGCDLAHKGHGLCESHLWRLRNWGDVHADIAVGEWGTWNVPTLPVKEGTVRCAIEDCNKAEYAEGLCDAHLKHAIGNLSINPEHMAGWEVSALKAMARNPDATTFVGETGMTVEQIRNSVRCPRCSAYPTSLCMFTNERSGVPFSKGKRELHDERVRAAVERFGLLETR